MTEFDFSSIIVAKGEGEVCGPDGCLPGEASVQAPSTAQNPPVTQSAAASTADATNGEQKA